MKIQSFVLFGCLCLCFSCKPAEKPADTTSVADTTTQQQTNASSVPAGALTFEGTLKTAEDAGYPMVALTLVSATNKDSLGVMLNLEGSQKVAPATVNGWLGKTVKVVYTETPETALLELEANGKKVMDPKFKPGKETKQFKGVLQKANAATAGDLPDEVTMEGEDKSTKTFKVFITKEMIPLNGKTVTAWYEDRIDRQVVSIEPVVK